MSCADGSRVSTARSSGIPWTWIRLQRREEETGMMRVVLCGLIAGALGVFLGCQTASDPEAMIAGAKALDQQFIEAFNRGDVDAVMATYWNSPEFIQYPVDAMEIHGWQAVKDALEKSFASTSKATIGVIDANYKAAGDVVIGWGTWRLTMTDPGGQMTTIDGRYTDMRAQRDGKWVYILDHGSLPLLPSAATTDSL
jgi:uncharacterized protein (TIGR02246 family)